MSDEGRRYEDDDKYDDEPEAIRKFTKFKSQFESIKTESTTKMTMEIFKKTLSLYYDIIIKINEMKNDLQFDINSETSKELKTIIDFIFDFYCSYPKFKKMLIYYLLKNIPDDKFNLIMNNEPINNLNEHSKYVHFKQNIDSKSTTTDLLNENSFNKFKQHLQNIYEDTDTFQDIITYVSNDNIELKIKLAIAILRDMTASNSGFVGLATFNKIFNSDYLILHMHIMLNIKEGNSINSVETYIRPDEMDQLNIKKETVERFYQKLNIFVNEYMQFISEHFKQFEETDKGRGSDDTSFFRIEYKPDSKRDNNVRKKLVVTTFIDERM
jgi:hypothetical protein